MVKYVVIFFVLGVMVFIEILLDNLKFFLCFFKEWGVGMILMLVLYDFVICLFFLYESDEIKNMFVYKNKIFFLIFIKI